MYRERLARGSHQLPHIVFCYRFRDGDHVIIWIASGKHVPLLLPNIVQPVIREGGWGDNVTLYNEPPRCHSYLRLQTNQTTYISLAPSTSSSQPGLKWNFSWGQSKSAFVILSGGTFLMGYLAKQNCGFISVLIINSFFFKSVSRLWHILWCWQTSPSTYIWHTFHRVIARNVSALYSQLEVKTKCRFW